MTGDLSRALCRALSRALSRGARLAPSFARLLTPLLALLLAACGGAQTPGGGDEPLTAARLYPLAEGNVWSYDVETGVGPPVLAISRVIGERGEVFEVRNDGGDAIEYERRPEGLWRVESETWLLRGPIEVGTEWASANGRTARIRSVDERVEVAAGTFEGCVRVDEAGGGDGRGIFTIYCPDVGPVVLETGLQAELSGMRASVRAELRGYMLAEEGAAADE